MTTGTGPLPRRSRLRRRPRTGRAPPPVRRLRTLRGRRSYGCRPPGPGRDRPSAAGRWGRVAQFPAPLRCAGTCPRVTGQPARCGAGRAVQGRALGHLHGEVVRQGQHRGTALQLGPAGRREGRLAVQGAEQPPGERAGDTGGPTLVHREAQTVPDVVPHQRAVHGDREQPLRRTVPGEFLDAPRRRHPRPHGPQRMLERVRDGLLPRPRREDRERPLHGPRRGSRRGPARAR